jgi:hypothetical protein
MIKVDQQHHHKVDLPSTSVERWIHVNQHRKVGSLSKQHDHSGARGKIGNDVDQETRGTLKTTKNFANSQSTSN